MKKLGLLVMPIITISILASCSPKTKTYHVKFTNGNEIIEEKDYKENEVIVAPSNPAPYEKDYKTYTFEAWYDDEFKFETGLTATKNYNFDAKFTSEYVIYTAVFHAKGEDQKVDFNATDTIKTTPDTGDTPSTGHTLYWLIGNEKVKPGDKYDFKNYLGTKTIDINYQSIANPHTITLKVSGQDDVEIESAYGEKILSEDVPQTKDYYDKIDGEDHYYHHFTGKWTKTQGGTDYVTSTDVLDDIDINIYAEFTKDENDPIKYTIKFFDTDGETELDTKEIYCPNDLTITAPEITEEPDEGYTLKWVSDTYVFDSEATITFDDDDDQNLPIANYNFVLTPIAIEYTITYVLDGGSLPTGKTNPTTYKIDETITLEAPEQEGFTFRGWYLAPNERNPLGGNGWNPGDRTGNLTLYADWHEANNTLDRHTWERISEISNAKTASKYFDIGETKTISMKDDDEELKNFNLRIIDYDRDRIKDTANTAGITFEFADTIFHHVAWGETGYGSRQFTKGPLYECLKEGGAVYNMINTVTDDSGKLMDYIKDVSKSFRYVAEYKWSDGTYDTKLFPLSLYEIEDYDNTVYYYYKGASDDKRAKDSFYWLRTPIEDESGNTAISCKSNGSIDFTNCFMQRDIAPAFCI